MTEPTPKMPFSGRLMELLMQPLEHLRARTIEQAHGKILEIGIGTGRNLAYYRGVETLYAIEPDAALHPIAQQRAAQAGITLELTEGGAESLPYPDESFDTVVITWVFCTIPLAEQAAQEIFRILRPDGAVHYIEHTASPHKGMRSLQNFFTPPWKMIAGGCRLNRDPHTILTQAGFHHERYRPINTAPWNPFPVYAGVAHKSPPPTEAA
ncbi:MAG: class I SAM-dependent methyltransferase [Myxococcales bacterium]|nr:class I SAM-dependent methyltransferase [Myxococcales bacterium]